MHPHARQYVSVGEVPTPFQTFLHHFAFVFVVVVVCCSMLFLLLFSPVLIFPRPWVSERGTRSQLFMAFLSDDVPAYVCVSVDRNLVPRVFFLPPVIIEWIIPERSPKDGVQEISAERKT